MTDTTTTSMQSMHCPRRSDRCVLSASSSTYLRRKSETIRHILLTAALSGLAALTKVHIVIAMEPHGPRLKPRHFISHALAFRLKPLFEAAFQIRLTQVTTNLYGVKP